MGATTTFTNNFFKTIAGRSRMAGVKTMPARSYLEIFRYVKSIKTKIDLSSGDQSIEYRIWSDDDSIFSPESRGSDFTAFNQGCLFVRNIVLLDD